MFNINDFKATIGLYGGPARSNLFVVEFTNTISTHMGAADLRFFCQTIKLPGIDIGSMEYKPQAFGLPQSMPMNLNPGGLSGVFMLDSDHMILSFFHEWMQKVVNYDVSNGVFSQVNNRLPYEIGYKEDYVTNMIVKQYSSTNTNHYYEYIFYDVFPTQIDGNTLSWSDNDSYATAAVNFSYSGMNYKGAVKGTPTERFARGTGLLSHFNSLNFGQNLAQSSLPKSIQEAINTYSKISNTFSAIKSILK